MGFSNTSHIDENSDGKVRRYVHSPLKIDHYGTSASIQANGRIILSKVAGKAQDGTIEYDELEIPASLVFKLASLLKATRKIEYVGLSEVKPEDRVDN
jgi:hypothetical protein